MSSFISSLSQEQYNQLNKVRLPDDWKNALAEVLLSETMTQLREFLKNEYEHKTIYPDKADMFKAFNLTPLSQTKVVILGQDPYHGAGQAMGLSFSVPNNIPNPPSLKNILKELQVDLNIPLPTTGDLTAWAKQGVLLLNSVLTVEQSRPASHQGQGWEVFTDSVIEVINTHTEHTVFMLWGAYAKNKGRYIDLDRHLVLTASHPSPLSANRGGFFGQRHFSCANEYLLAHGKGEINWWLP